MNLTRMAETPIPHPRPIAPAGEAALAVVVNLTLVACLWAWYATTFPVNDGLAATWRAAEWRGAAVHLGWRALGRAVVLGLGVWLLLRWAAAYRALPRRWVPALALGAAGSVLVAGVAGALWVWRTRPLW
jgi:hypothetical protein